VHSADLPCPVGWFHASQVNEYYPAPADDSANFFRGLSTETPAPVSEDLKVRSPANATQHTPLPTLPRFVFATPAPSANNALGPVFVQKLAYHASLC